MKIRYTNQVNFITQKRIRPGKRYWAFPGRVNSPTRLRLIPVTEESLRKLMRYSIGRRMYGSVPIRRIHPDDVVFRHPFERNRNVLRKNLQEYIQPLYRVKSPKKRTPTPKKRTPTPRVKSHA
jgi:hypothetical protein